MIKLFFFFLFTMVCYSAIAINTEIKYLSGEDKDHTISWNFFCTKGMNSGKWSTIPVPSHWEFQGFGAFNYGQNEKVFNDEQGLYKYEFSVPKSWKKKNEHANATLIPIQLLASAWVSLVSFWQ